MSSSPSTPLPTEHQLEGWFSEVLIAVGSTPPEIASTVRSLSLAATSESARRSTCEFCKRNSNELKQLTQMLLQTMESSVRPAEGQQTFTPELVKKIEEAIWGEGNHSGSIVVDIGSWFIREIPNGTVSEQLLIGLAAGANT